MAKWWMPCKIIKIINFYSFLHPIPKYGTFLLSRNFVCYHFSVIFLFQREEKNAFKSLGTGNRIATVLFYVSTCSILLQLKFDPPHWMGPRSIQYKQNLFHTWMDIISWVIPSFYIVYSIYKTEDSEQLNY